MFLHKLWLQLHRIDRNAITLKKEFSPAFFVDEQGSRLEIHVRNPNASMNEDELVLTCEQIKYHPDACDLFGIERNIVKSNTSDWFGSLKTLRPLRYRAKSHYQFIIRAQLKVLIRFFIEIWHWTIKKLLKVLTRLTKRKTSSWIRDKLLLFLCFPIHIAFTLYRTRPFNWL